MLAYSYSPRFTLRLPVGNTNTSIVNIIVQIRDILNCVAEYSLRPVIVRADTAEVATLANVLQQTDIKTINNNPTVQLLASKNPNVVGQVLTAVSQVFNQINSENIHQAISSKAMNSINIHSIRHSKNLGGVPAASISISPLGGTSRSAVNFFHRFDSMSKNRFHLR